FSIDTCTSENAGLHCLHSMPLRELKDPLRVGRGSDDETHREAVAARKSRRHDGEHLNSWNGAKLLLDDRQIISCWRFACAPWFQHHSAKALIGIRNLKCEPRVRNILEDFPRGISITNRVVDGRVGRRRDDPKNHALVLGRRQFLRRECWYQESHDDGEG